MVYQEQTQKHMKNINNIQGSHDINKSQKNIMTLDQSRIKCIYLDKSQKAYSLFIKDLGLNMSILPANRARLNFINHFRNM